MVVTSAIRHSLAYRGTVVTILLVAMSRRQFWGQTSYFCTHNVHKDAGLARVERWPIWTRGMREIELTLAINHPAAYRDIIMGVLVVAMSRRQFWGQKSYFCTHNVHKDAGACTCWKVAHMNSAHGENMMSALHQPPPGIPRYHHDRVGSSYE